MLLRQGLSRTFSSLGSRGGAVELAFDRASPAKAVGNRPLVILHGLFGSKQNWRSLSKSMATRLETLVYSVDLRNHGESPHTNEMSLELMARDLALFVASHELKDPVILGHSLGARVAMHYALSQDTHTQKIGKLIVSDMSPTSTLKKSLDLEDKIYAMEQVISSGATTKAEAKRVLAEHLKEKQMVDFLLTNFVVPSIGGKSYWRINVPAIKHSLESFWEFPYENSGRVFLKPTLFIGAAYANYIRPQHEGIIHRYFPSAEISYINAGHWIHAEKPIEFLELVSHFYNLKAPCSS